MVKILNCYLHAKKSYGTLSKGAIFFGQPCICTSYYSYLEILLSSISIYVLFAVTSRPKCYYLQVPSCTCLSYILIESFQQHKAKTKNLRNIHQRKFR